MKFLTLIAFLFASAFAFGQKSTAVSNNKLLQGQWTSVDDSRYKITLADSSFTEYYGKQITNRFFYKVKNNILTKYAKRSDEMYEYSILNLTQSQLQLLSLPKGDILKFEKKNTKS